MILKIKLKRNKVLFLMLALCISGTPTVVMANSIGVSSDNGLHVSKASHNKKFVINELHKLGFTNKEIKELFEEFPYDENVPLIDFNCNNNSSKGDLVSKINMPIMLRARPGQKKNETYCISTKWVKGLGHSISIGSAGLGLSKSAWAKLIVKKVGWKIAILAATIAAAVSDMYMGPNGVKINVTYTWGYGDNSMEWYWSPIRFNASKY